MRRAAAAIALLCFRWPFFSETRQSVGEKVWQVLYRQVDVCRHTGACVRAHTKLIDQSIYKQIGLVPPRRRRRSSI